MLQRLRNQFDDFLNENLSQMAHIVDSNSYYLTFKIQADEDPDLDTPYIRELYLEYLKPSGQLNNKDILKELLKLSKKANSILKPTLKKLAAVGESLSARQP